MNSVLLHHNPIIFPNPRSFLPQRWIDNPRLGKYLVSFTKGSRQCLGINLAYAELYLCLASIVLSFPDMQLTSTTVEDVEFRADYFVPRASGMGIKLFIG